MTTIPVELGVHDVADKGKRPLPHGVPNNGAFLSDISDGKTGQGSRVVRLPATGRVEVRPVERDAPDRARRRFSVNITVIDLHHGGVERSDIGIDEIVEARLRGVGAIGRSFIHRVDLAPSPTGSPHKERNGVAISPAGTVWCMGAAADEFVKTYIAEMEGKAMDLSRLVDEPSGLDAPEMMAAFAHPNLGRLGITLMADFMAPEGSIYYDAIFGAYMGQHAIRGWLVPAMADIEFIDFAPMAESVTFDDGEGGTTLDEWQMIMNLGETKIPLSRGVSVRRYRDGWITWACDVYDTAAFRQPPPPEMPGMPGMPAEAPPPLPPWPRVEWTTATSVVPAPLSAAASAWVAQRRAARAADQPLLLEAASGLSHSDIHDLTHDPVTGYDFELVSDLFHPTDSVYIDPLFGEFHGQAAIRSWLTDIMPRAGALAFEPLGGPLFDGTTSVLEWKQMAVAADGTRTMMLRGTSVRRYADGWVVYAADYFDTAPLADPDIASAAVAAGATITVADILRYRPV